MRISRIAGFSLRLVALTIDRDVNLMKEVTILDFATIVGLVVAFGGLMLGITLEGGTIASFFSASAAVIVFGGTLGATILCYSFEELKRIPAMLRIVFSEPHYDPSDMIAILVRFAEKARREGLLALEDELITIDDKFLQKGMQLVIDGTDAELVRNILETELNFMQERHTQGASIFESAGGYAPTMGIVGTVMGLVHVLANITDTDSLGPLIAAAFIATFYGIASANLIFLPIATKLRNRSNQQILIHEVALEGILSVQSGDNPRIVEEKLKAFLAPKLREAREFSRAREE